MPHRTAPPPSFLTRPLPRGGSIDRFVFPPTPTIRDPRLMLGFAARLMAESPDSYLYVIITKGWMQEHRPHLIYEPKGHGYAIGGFFDRIDELVGELRRIMGEVSVYACPNPARRSDRGAHRNRLAQFGDGRGMKKGDVEVIRYAMVDIDPDERKPDQNATHAEREAPLKLTEEIRFCEEEVAMSSRFGSSGNGAHILVRLPDLPNDHRNRAAVREFVKAVARKFPRSWTKPPGSDVYAKAKIDEHIDISTMICFHESLEYKYINS
jgi:hypothetical protein